MEELYEALNTVEDGVGEFACCGSLPELGYPGLCIENVGNISFPLRKEQAEKIIGVAKESPCGFGAQRLVDETVGKSWQLEPNQIAIKNNHFIDGVNNLVAVVKKNLGCGTKAVEANLYKMLLYETGGHFELYRNIEKDSGMFATIIIQLPSHFEGGKLAIRHEGKEKVVNFDGEESAFCCKYAALYCDCEHEVSEIKSGYRVALVYCLCWIDSDSPPSVDAVVTRLQNIAQILEKIFEDEGRRLFMFFLSHKYTVGGLSGRGINALKGTDEAVARALVLANERLPEKLRLDFHIVEVTRELTKDGYFDWEGCFQFEEYDNECDNIEINTWYKFDGSERKVGGIGVDINEDVCRPSDKPQEKYMEQVWGDEYNTDNTADTQTDWFRTYGIIAWPKVKFLQMICKTHYTAAVRCVYDQLAQVQTLASSNSSYQLALKDLETVVNYGISNSVSLYGSTVSTMLRTLTMLRLEDGLVATLANLFLVKVLAKPGAIYGLDSDGLIRPLVRLTLTVGWPSLSEALGIVFNSSPVTHHSRWVDFLHRLYRMSKEKEILREDVVFKSIMTCLVKKLEAEAQNEELETAGADAKVQTLASLLFLLGDEQLLKKFTAAICLFSERSPESSLLKNLIQSLGAKKFRDNQFWQQLVSRRINQLEKIEKLGIRPFSWNQEEAVVAGHPRVQAFLRGPLHDMKYEAFESMKDARDWNVKHFSPSLTPSYSATTTVGGRGRNSYVEIVKTRDWYDGKVSRIKRQLRELKKLRAIVKPQVVASTGNSSAEQREPQAKRRAVCTS